MEIKENHKVQGDAHIYAYPSGDSAYAYGYGGTQPQTAAHKQLRDYLLTLRERIWYIVVVFLVVFSATIIYTFTKTPLYRSAASVQIFRKNANPLNFNQVTENVVMNVEDLNTQAKLLESAMIVEKVAARLTPEETKQFMAPYEKGRLGDPITPIEVLGENRKIMPQRLSLVIAIQYSHPDRLVAAKIANLFVDEYMAYTARTRIDDSMKAVEDLKVRADQQTKKVEQIGTRLQKFLEENKAGSLDQRKDIVTDNLKQLNSLSTQYAALFREARVRWEQVKEYRESGRSLLEIPFISNDSLITQLQQTVSGQKVAIAKLSERYRAKHPTMIESVNALAQTEKELEKAVKAAADMVESNYDSTKRNYEEAKLSAEQAENDSLMLSRLSVEYENIKRELQVEEGVMQHLLGRMRETSLSTTLDTSNARIVDRAFPSQAPYSPNIPLNIAMGLFGALGLGVMFAFLIALVDDRVKSGFDIESIVGLPLIGIAPQIKNMPTIEKAKVVINNSDRQVVEAFLTLHSSLRLKEESKNAKAILVTSTIPGEGKSFIASNLALTFAAHGEKVVLVDCDLRKPTVHKNHKVDNTNGVIDYCSGNIDIEKIIARNVYPNFDVVPAGGRAKNPTQILNSKKYELLISELRKRYDRVFIDTPPLAAVSDAMVVLPLMDGSLFTIYFNKVRRKAAQFAAKKLLESNVPNMGAVLNGLNVEVSGYYYAQYYDKSYKDYYTVTTKKDGLTVKG